MSKPAPPKSPPPPRPSPRRLAVVGQPEALAERADAARNRARILSAARRLLGRRPIHEICMDELAKAAGVGKGTLYRRFADRSSLCLALLDDAERQLQDRVLAGFDLPKDAPALSRLFVLLDALLTFTMENAALLAEAAAFERGPVARFEHPVYVWRRRELVRLIALSERARSLPPLDAEISADLILACLDADLMRRHLRETDDAALRGRYLAFFARSLGLSGAP
jgi:AcrR family transcriptional regulator